MARVIKNKGRQRFLDNLKKNLEKEVSPVLDKGIRIREDYVSGWSAYNQPEFKKEISIVRGQLNARITFDANPAEGSTEGLSVYELLRDGTEVRRANLSADWESKTMENSLQTKEGAGRVIDVKPFYEFPGIDERNTDKLANEEIAQEIEDAIQRALNKF